MCEGTRQQKALMTYERELREFLMGFWKPNWSWLNGSVIYLYHSVYWSLSLCVCVCLSACVRVFVSGCHF